MSEVNHNHYKQGAMQPIEYIESNDLNFNEGNIIKYVTRWCFKNGAQDLCKVVHYALMLIKEYFGLPQNIIEDIMTQLDAFNNNELHTLKDVKRAK